MTHLAGINVEGAVVRKKTSRQFAATQRFGCSQSRLSRVKFKVGRCATDITGRTYALRALPIGARKRPVAGAPGGAPARVTSCRLRRRLRA
jgi:hypothetical protein